MISFRQIAERFKREPTDLVGIDVSPGATYAVRMRKSNKEITVTATDVLPAVTLPQAPDEGAPAALSIPNHLRAKYACMVCAGSKGVIKFLSFPGPFENDTEGKLVQNLGLSDPDDYRIAYHVVVKGHGKSESRVIAVAIPEPEARGVISLLPSGLPAPYSLEVADLASLTAFQHACGRKHAEEAVGVMNFGVDASSFALFSSATLVLIRRFDIGINSLLSSVQKNLGVDTETASGIISDGSFDISHAVSEVMESLTKQIVLSRDFVERREDCHVQHIYLSGELADSRDVVEELHASTGLDVSPWNPFEGLTVGKSAFKEGAAGKEWRFSAAVGACLGTFEEL